MADIHFDKNGNYVVGGTDVENLDVSREPTPDKPQVIGAPTPAPPPPKQESSGYFKPGTFSLAALRMSAAKANTTVSKTGLPKQDDSDLEFSSVEISKRDEEATVVPTPSSESENEPESKDEAVAEGEATTEVATEPDTVATQQEKLGYPQFETNISMEEIKVEEKDKKITAETTASSEVGVTDAEIVTAAIGVVEEQLSAEESVDTTPTTVEEGPALTNPTRTREPINLDTLRGKAVGKSPVKEVKQIKLEEESPAPSPAPEPTLAPTPAPTPSVSNGAAEGKFNIVPFRTILSAVSMSDEQFSKWCFTCYTKTLDCAYASFVSDTGVCFYKYLPSGRSNALTAIVGLGDDIACVRISHGKTELLDANNEITVKGAHIASKKGAYLVLYSQRR